MRLIESMNSFQAMTRKEIGMLQDRMTYIEQLVEKVSKAVDRSVQHSGGHTSGLYTPPAPSGDESVKGEGKPMSAKKQETAWNKVLEYIKQKRYNDVYNWILGKKDDLLLIRLMGKTGVVIDQLDSQNVEFLLYKIVDLIGSREFVDLLLAWIIAAVDRKVVLSLNIQSAILEALSYLLGSEGASDYRLDEMQISEANRVYNILKASLSSFNNA